MPAPSGCDRFRDFTAEFTNNRESVWTYDYREVPIPKFKLQNESPDEDYKLNVWVWVNKKRIKFHNRSDLLVDVSWTMRCKI